MLQSGTVVAQKYKIIQKIGAGGMSTVYLAEDINLNKRWTVKEIKKSGDKREKANIRSLIAEANLIKKLDHPAIPRIVDIIETADTLFIVRDFVDGDPMDQVLQTYGAQPQYSVVEWAQELCDVLDYLHHQQPKIIYRDLKPANLMLVSDGSLRLIDFGIAREVVQGKDEVRAGTRGYAPPEQLMIGGRTDERSDIYALGMTLYQLATGISPAGVGFDPNRLASDVNPLISVRFAKIIEKCVQSNPDDRFQNCGELRFALGRLTTGDEHEKKEKIRSVLVKSAGVLCIILFAVSMALALASGSKIGQAEWLAPVFQRLSAGSLDAKTILFVLALLFLAGYGFLRIRNTERRANKKTTAVLHTSQSNYVVPQAQEGSMMDLLREAAITENSARWDLSSRSGTSGQSASSFSGTGGRPEKNSAKDDVQTALLDTPWVKPVEVKAVMDEVTAVIDEPVGETEVLDAMKNGSAETSVMDEPLSETEMLDDFLTAGVEAEDADAPVGETEMLDDFLAAGAEAEDADAPVGETEMLDDSLTADAEVQTVGELSAPEEDDTAFRIVHSEIVVHAQQTIELNI